MKKNKGVLRHAWFTRCSILYLLKNIENILQEIHNMRAGEITERAGTQGNKKKTMTVPSNSFFYVKSAL